MQLTLPIFPAGSILISDRLFAISNFIKLRLCKKAKVMRAFHVSESFVQRACKKARTEGEAGVFSKDNRKGRNHVIVESVRGRLQDLLDIGNKRERYGKAI